MYEERSENQTKKKQQQQREKERKCTAVYSACEYYEAITLLLKKYEIFHIFSPCVIYLLFIETFSLGFFPLCGFTTVNSSSSLTIRQCAVSASVGCCFFFSFFSAIRCTWKYTLLIIQLRFDDPTPCPIEHNRRTHNPVFNESNNNKRFFNKNDQVGIIYKYVIRIQFRNNNKWKLRKPTILFALSFVSMLVAVVCVYVYLMNSRYKCI